MAAFFTSGVVSRSKKAKAIRHAFENRASELLTNFLLVLNDHDRLDLLRVVDTAYRELLEERAGHVRVHVLSAVPLLAEQADKLRRELRETFHREPVLEAKVDPDLLGGLVVQLGDWVYDGSVRTRLQNLKHQILMESSHEIQGGRDRFGSQDGN
jgi:F-type H+-transporting ATPase subunit delta